MIIYKNRDNRLKWIKFPQYCKTNPPTYLSLKNDPTRIKIPLNYLFSPFSLKLQFSPMLRPFLTLQTHLFHLLTYKKEIMKNFSIYCKRTKRQHNTRKKQKVSFTISFFDFSFSNCTYEPSSMKSNETLSVLFWSIYLFFKLNPIFHLSNIVC